MNKEQIITTLGLQSHIEGGYFRRTYESEQCILLKDDEDENKPRHLLTSIYYLLTDDNPIGHFHRNRSSIIHYFHLGGTLKYFLISPDGQLETTLLGSDLAQGQQLQLTVPGNYWKASQLITGEYALISEAVAPGFDYADMQIATAQMLEDYPHLQQQLSYLVKQ